MSAVSQRFTLDTNILMYAVDHRFAEKQRMASEIVDKAVASDCRLTLQSLSEFYVAVSRKGIVEATTAAAQVNDWLAAFSCVAGTESAIRTALISVTARRASYWDALLVATAAEAGCSLILTEDMADGATLGGVEIHNPFAPAGGLTDRTRELLDL